MTVKPKKTLIIGGAASGKSAYAEGLASNSKLYKIYLASANIYDEEMQDQLALKLAYARLVRGNRITGLRNEWIGLHNVSEGQIRSSLGRAFNNPELLLKGVS